LSAGQIRSSDRIACRVSSSWTQRLLGLRPVHAAGVGEKHPQDAEQRGEHLGLRSGVLSQLVERVREVLLMAQLPRPNQPAAVGADDDLRGKVRCQQFSQQTADSQDHFDGGGRVVHRRAECPQADVHQLPEGEVDVLLRGADVFHHHGPGDARGDPAGAVRDGPEGAQRLTAVDVGAGARLQPHGGAGGNRGEQLGAGRLGDPAVLGCGDGQAGCVGPSRERPAGLLVPGGLADAAQDVLTFVGDDPDDVADLQSAREVSPGARR
jgi:hypothetical protein